MMHAGYPGQSSDTRKMTDCKYHMEGRCTMGDRCPFRHLPELFNSTARAQLAPHSQPSVCHFYVTGKCTKGDMCPFQHPGAQKEMQIDFDDDESPKQAQQSHVASKAVASAQAQSQAQPQAVSGQPGQVLSTKPAAVRRPEQATAPQQPLSNRLGPRPVAQRLSVQNTASAQEESSQAKKSVFQRLAGVRKAPTVQDRLSKPAPTELDSRPIKQAAKRPKDARELLMETVAAKARVGRKEAELGGRTPSSQVRKSSSEVEPTSIAQRRMVPVNRAGRNSPATPHAPKFSSPAPQESTGQRKSALERIAPIQNGSVSTSSVAAPVNPTKPRRATIEPYSSSRLRPNPTSQTPSSAPSASGGAAPAATPAAGSASAATPSSEQSGGGTDRRGRQKITWQPPTASQREDTVQEVRQSMSKRKASDAASPAVDAAAAAAEETSPSKRIKAASDPADSQQAAPAVQGLATDEQPKQEPMAHAPHPTLVAEQAKQQQQQQQAVSTTEAQPVESALDVDDNAELYMDQELEDADEDDILYDDFDDEATMRELEALG